MPRLSRGRVGISVCGRDIRAAIIANGEIVWQCEESWRDKEELRGAVARALPNTKAAWWHHPVATAAVSTEYSRVRTLVGLPENLSALDATDIVATNRDRYFVARFANSVTTSLRAEANGQWSAALLDADIVTEIFQGCRVAGYRLQSVVPVAGLMKNLRVDEFFPEDVRYNAAIAAADYDAGMGLLLVPAEAVAERKMARGGRMRIASVALLVAACVALQGPNIRSALEARSVQRRIQRLQSTDISVRAKLDSLVKVSNALAAVSGESRSAIHALNAFAKLEAELVGGALVQQVNMDSTALEITLLTDDAAEAVKTLATLHPSIQLTGQVTSEAAPSTLQRVVLRLRNPATTVKRKRVGQLSIATGARQ